MTARSYRFSLGERTVDYSPKKHLGQNFLVDPNIQRKIIDACDLHPNETVLEIGPGLGVLTEEIARRVNRLIVIETDIALVKELENKLRKYNVQIIHADFLKYPVGQLPKQLKVIGNLPYYISTPILERVITHPEQFKALFATLQLELGQRLKAPISSKEYGAFTCFVQYYMNIEILFKIKNSCFKPVPKVDSCFLKFTRREEGEIKATDKDFLFQVIHHAFQQRRKTIVNALSPLRPATAITAVLENLKINPKARAENLSLTDYIHISNQLG